MMESRGMWFGICKASGAFEVLKVEVEDWGVFAGLAVGYGGSVLPGFKRLIRGKTLLRHASHKAMSLALFLTARASSKDRAISLIRSLANRSMASSEVSDFGVPASRRYSVASSAMVSAR